MKIIQHLIITISIIFIFSFKKHIFINQYNYDVTIYRDIWGVPHIYGDTDADAAYGLAYAHSEDDFKTIQDVLMAARGISASIKGK